MSTTFKHKTMPITITYSEWSNLSQIEKNNFTIENAATSTVINNTTINKTDDVLGLGKLADTAACLAIAPVVIVGGIFGMFD